MSPLHRIDEDAVSHRMVDGEAVVINLDTTVYYGLNRSASMVWERLAGGPATDDELAEGLAAAFDLAPEVARADVADLLDRLHDEGLVTRADDGAGGAGGAWPAEAEAYVAPQVERYERLEQLMLSGE